MNKRAKCIISHYKLLKVKIKKKKHIDYSILPGIDLDLKGMEESNVFGKDY